MKTGSKEKCEHIWAIKNGKRYCLNCYKILETTEPIPPKTGSKEKIEKLDDLIAAQKESLTSEYMRGLYNGLVCAKSVFTGEEPKYVDCKIKTGSKNKVLVVHGNKTHKLGDDCKFCDKVKKEFDAAVKSGEIDKILNPPKTGSKVMKKEELEEYLDSVDSMLKSYGDKYCPMCGFYPRKLKKVVDQILDQAIQSAVKEAKSEIAEKIQNLFKSDYSVTKNQLKDLLK